MSPSAQHEAFAHGATLAPPPLNRHVRMGWEKFVTALRAPPRDGTYYMHLALAKRAEAPPGEAAGAAPSYLSQVEAPALMQGLQACHTAPPTPSE